MLREVTTKNGMVRGVPAADPRITAFRGIPYAKPPVGELRFRAPEPAEPWEGVRVCESFGPIPMQDVPGADPTEFYAKEWHVDPKVPMGEDCLYLNVWTPARSTQERMPVLVWIFGGGFQCGYSSEMEFDGERMARRGIVVVSLNYRVNIFGMYAHKDLEKENPGGPCTNFGLLDQRMAIQWVRENIEAFGGDAQRITIGGQSAGAGSVLYQVVSPKTEGMFEGAIMQSGGGMRTWAYGRLKSLSEAQEQGEDFLRFAGLSSLEEARKISADELFGHYVRYRDIHGYVCFQPCVDGWFLPDDPSEMVKKGQHKKIAYLMGHTSGESFGIPDSVEAFREGIRLRYPDIADALLEAAGADTPEAVRSLYAGDMFNSRAMANVLFCQNQLKLGERPAYLYYFAPTTVPGDNAGAFHSSDLWFMFETLAKSTRPFVGAHYDLARKMCNYWVNFVKTGDPNGPDADGEPMPVWRPFEEGAGNCMRLNEEEMGMQKAKTALAEVFINKYL